MRPGQQNNSNNKNRQRGRNNNGGRKHMNPLSRNYESNGPDVKVRGNAAHIAEKYVQLARDAHASGDSVMAENYLQHAEHYFRILSAAQPQQPRPDQFGQELDTEESDDDYIGDEQADRFEVPQFRQQQNERPPERQFTREQPRDERQPRIEQGSRDEQPDVEAPVEAIVETQEASAEVSPEAVQADGEPRRRERRPRRRRTPAGEAGVDPAGPQPDVGELPAFITAGAPNPAE
ncbi:MAG TPA: DUF4167 domain-containing protein [Devosiaceae bacterium]|nr:DUF4167 domain-containing protein [Devosiaceae bacterium]